jgi:hypothetical protein
LKLDNCSSILKIYRKVFLPCSFIKIFSFEVNAFLKNNFIKIQKLWFSILWCWAIPWVVELRSASFMSILCIRLVLKLKIEKLHTWGHAQIDRKSLKSLKIGIFMIFINFGVPLWSKFFLKSFETLHAYQTIYKIPLCKNLRRFNFVCARNGRSKFARARGENFAHSWFRINSAFPRHVNDIVYDFNANLNE